MKFCILYLINWWCITMFSTTNLSISCHLVSNKQVLFKAWFWWFYWSFSFFLLALIVISLSPFRLLLLGYLESQNFPSTLPHSCLIIFSSEVSFLWIVIYKPLYLELKKLKVNFSGSILLSCFAIPLWEILSVVLMLQSKIPDIEKCLDVIVT